jgi:hypothetical protein
LKGLNKFWGLAVEQLPYESAAGGYQGQTWNTAEVLFDEEGLGLPRDDGTLLHEILALLPDEAWCDFDWLALNDDEALRMSWDAFCETVKHERRFFFHRLGRREDDHDAYSAEELLKAVALLCQDAGLVRDLPTGTRLWRARPDIKRGKRAYAADFGPPPKELARQSNRMNPPGIPLMYVASSAQAALAETRAHSARIGSWTTLRPARLLDLRRMPSVPGTFSEASRHETLGIRFLWGFAEDIMKAVARDERVHIDYLPSQVVTEYMRDFSFDGGPLDGIAYQSTVHPRGWNAALFVDALDIGLKGREPFEPQHGPWLAFRMTVRRGATQAHVKRPV